jgi:hypothetical protein
MGTFLPPILGSPSPCCCFAIFASWITNQPANRDEPPALTEDYLSLLSTVCYACVLCANSGFGNMSRKMILDFHSGFWLPLQQLNW